MVHLESGSSFFASLATIELLGLCVGMEINSHEIAELEFGQQVIAATDKAADLLSRRDHSTAQLRTKLVSRKFKKDVIDEACRSCIDRGYLDDRRFAKRWIESRTRKRNEGVLRLRAGLARAGVSRQIIEDVVSETLDEEYEIDAFQREIDSLESRSVSAPSVIRRLSSLGFPAHLIHEYAERRSEAETSINEEYE